MNRGEFRTAVKERLAIPTIGDGLLSDTTLNSLINRSLSVIASAKEWPWLLDDYTMNFVSGSASLPNDFIRARSLVIDSKPTTWLQLEDFIMPDRMNGAFAWTIIGNKAKLTPLPTSTLTGTLYYYRNEPNLASDASTPLIPTVHHSLIVAYTCYLASMTRQDEGRAAVYQAEYQALLNNTRDDLKQNTGRRIRYDGGYQYATWS